MVSSPSVRNRPGLADQAGRRAVKSGCEKYMAWFKRIYRMRGGRRLCFQGGKKIFFPAPLISPDRDIRELRFRRIKFDAAKEIRRTPAGQVFLGLDDRRHPVRLPWGDMIEHVHILGGQRFRQNKFCGDTNLHTGHKVWAACGGH